MARTHDTLRQGDTDLMVFHQTTADTAGAYVEVEATYAPMGRVRPPAHSHPHQDEFFQVLDGELSVEIEGKHRTLTSGDELELPSGTRHAMWNASEDRTRFRWRTTPALRTEMMYETLWGLANDGEMGRHGTPRPALLQSAMLMLAYRREFRPAAPPHQLLVPLCAVLSVPAFALGYRSRYARYSRH